MPVNSAKLAIGFLFDDTLDSNDGVAQYVKVLGAWLSDQGHRVSYLVGETKAGYWHGGKIYSLAKNQKVTFNGNRLSMPLPANRLQIKELLIGEKFDLLHVQVPYSPLMAQRVIRALDKKVALIGTFHIFPAGWLARWGSRLLRLAYGTSLKRFDQMLAVSPAAAQFSGSAFGLKTQIIPNIVDLKKFKAGGLTPRSSKSRQIVFLGRLVERKGCQKLLEAFRLLRTAMPDVRLTIAGDGPERGHLERYVKTNNLSKSVEFIGFIDEAEKPTFLANADIACFPSLYGESFGIVLIEAMAAGAGVVIGGNNPGYNSVLKDRSELLVDPNNTSTFAAQLEKLLRDSALSNKLHEWQQTEVKKYDVEVVGPTILNIYRQAVAKRLTNSHN